MAKKRIFARISESTKEHIEPADMMIPPGITVTPASFEAVTGLIEEPRKPTKALRALLAGRCIDEGD